MSRSFDFDLSIYLNTQAFIIYCQLRNWNSRGGEVYDKFFFLTINSKRKEKRELEHVHLFEADGSHLP